MNYIWVVLNGLAAVMWLITFIAYRFGGYLTNESMIQMSFLFSSLFFSLNIYFMFKKKELEEKQKEVDELKRQLNIGVKAALIQVANQRKKQDI